MTGEHHAGMQPSVEPVPSGASGVSGSLAFICGADMNPLQVRSRFTSRQARFVAIASMPGSQAGPAGLPTALGSGEIWGIVLGVPDAIVPEATLEAGAPNPPRVSIVLRDGSSTEATLMTGPATVGSVAAVLQEAHYWELPVPYRDRLKALLLS